jgi:hypothetical protein
MNGRLTGRVTFCWITQISTSWHALVLANPIWYPNLDRAVRAALLNLAENVLAVDHFEPGKVNAYLESN